MRSRNKRGPALSQQGLGEGSPPRQHPDRRQAAEPMLPDQLAHCQCIVCRYVEAAKLRDVGEGELFVIGALSHGPLTSEELARAIQAVDDRMSLDAIGRGVFNLANEGLLTLIWNPTAAKSHTRFCLTFPPIARAPDLLQ